jgi:hypothetical protein
MRKHVAISLVAFVVLYLSVGAFLGGYVLGGAIPATSWAGRAYLTVTWPCWIKGSPIPKPPVGAWAFNFNK